MGSLTAAPPERSPKSDEQIQLTIGDSLATVQAVLKASVTPAGARTATNTYETQIRLPDRGIWVFLGPDNRALQYRFDAPFSGNIDGASIGMTIEQTQAAFGDPLDSIRIPGVTSGQSFMYQAKSGTAIRCDFDSDGRLRTIRVLGGTIAFNESPPHAAEIEPAEGSSPPIVTREGGVTRLTIPGSLAVTHRLDCVTLDAVDNSITPPDLYAAIPQCLASNRYGEAVALFVFAGAEASFDALRVTDKTAGQARQVMIMNTFGSLPAEQRQRFSDVFKASLADPKTLGNICVRMREVGPPSYYPRYMVLHGIKAFNGDPFKNAVEDHFDAETSWTLVQRTYVQCPGTG